VELTFLSASLADQNCNWP